MPEQKKETAPGPESEYQRHLAAGELHLQRCKDCQSHIFYPRYLCPTCGSTHLDWVRASGLGTVYSTTVMRRRAEDGGDYNVALVDLAEGPRTMSRIEGIAPAEVRIGMPVRARIADDGQKGLFLLFEPAGEAHVR